MASLMRFVHRLLDLIGRNREAAAGVECSCSRGGERGAELVEFALVLPLLLVVVAGIIDFGFLFQRYEVVTNAAREGARVAILSGYKKADVELRVKEYITTGIGPTAPTPTVELGTPKTVTPGSGAPPFQTVTVTVKYTDSYAILGPIISLIGGDSKKFNAVTLTASSTMRVES